MNLFYDEISSKLHEKSTDEESIIKIHSIAVASFNILSRQKKCRNLRRFHERFENSTQEAEQ
jgi:hypothetical protein